jgi:hypothetical protein
MENTENLSVAEKYYKNHLLAVHRYEDKNRDKIREKNRAYYLKLKNENNNKYNELIEYHKNQYTINKDTILDKSKQNYLLNKEKKKLYYQNVVKPKLLLKKQQQQTLI